MICRKTDKTTIITKDEVHAKIKAGLYMLVRNDGYLMEKDLHERTITHKLANYYEKLFRGWDVDCSIIDRKSVV